ncbi:MAG: TSUP family transporter [Myxococcota bacterium]
MAVLSGLLAGVLTTLAGMGGGLLLLLALSVVLDPLSALVITSPAMLLGNLHRLRMYFAQVEWPVVKRLWWGALPGSVLGGWLAVGLPTWTLRLLMAAMALLAILNAVGVLRGTPPRAAVTPIGGLLGVIHGTSGGAGPLLGALFQSFGLRNVRYVASMAAVASAMHIARLFAYGAGGAVTVDLLLQGTFTAVAVIIGNLLGERLRRWMGEGAQRRLQQVTLFVIMGVAVGSLGLGRV